MKAIFISSGTVVTTVTYVQGEPGCTLPYDLRLDVADDHPAELGWTYADGVFTAPTPPPVTKPINVVLWLSRFTPQERVAIRAARTSNPIIDDFWLMLEDVRLPEIDIALPSVEAGLDYLISLNLIAADRKAAILA
jgi:hypothetical protein